MPKSKRNKQIELAKTKKRGLEWKKKLFEEVRSCVDSYSNIFVFSVNDMRNSKMKTVREQWKHSRFFIGKNKIMAMALGRFAEEEYKPNLHKIGQRIKGQRGLLFSNKSSEEVLSWFRSYSEGDFARSGNSATEDVKLAAGPLPQFSHSLEPYLRQLGLPTSLVKGVIHLVKDHEVCKAGDILTPETAKIIKLLGYEMSEFHFNIICMWAQDGSFMQFNDVTNAEEEKKMLLKQTKLAETCSSPGMEKMDFQNSESKITEMSLSTPKASIKDIEINTSPIKLLTSSTQFESLNLKENDKTQCVKKPPKTGKQKLVRRASDEINTNEEVESDNRPSRSRKREITINEVNSKQDSILRTPDNPNVSQDSPIFRELRNRSVKVNRKRNKNAV